MSWYTSDGGKPRFWQENGEWFCRVPPKGEGHEKLYEMWHGPLWWKTHGLIGRGPTKNAALADLWKWESAAKVVAEIY